ncbi:hypothetical protein VNO78_25324 [Psophocarpus tetragonolobus]|uniref:Uncharacterized protein n=1 Tax=Psophocarpus tetragonolobus TaxID=3891 RepID=A0AAN9S7L0_PSOTE
MRFSRLSCLCIKGMRFPFLFSVYIKEKVRLGSEKTKRCEDFVQFYMESTSITARVRTHEARPLMLQWKAIKSKRTLRCQDRVRMLLLILKDKAFSSGLWCSCRNESLRNLEIESSAETAEDMSSQTEALLVLESM